MIDYSCALTTAHDANEVTKALIKRIYALHTQHGHSAEFTMSLTMTYTQQDELYCAGFGIGDTCLVLKRDNGELEQLTYHCEVEGFKDAFDDYSKNNLELVISRNKVFHVKVQPNDEIVGYTYLPCELETMVAQRSTDNINPTIADTQLVKYFSLNTQLINKDMSLFTQLLTLAEEKHQQLITDAKQRGEAYRSGDDFTVSRMVIPSPILIHKIQVECYVQEIHRTIDNCIIKKNSEMSVFSFFNTRITDDIRRMKLYKNMLEKYNERLFNRLIICTAILDNNQDTYFQQQLLLGLDFATKEEAELAMTHLICKILQSACHESVHDYSSALNSVKLLKEKIVFYSNSHKLTTIDETFSAMMTQLDVPAPLIYNSSLG